ncbi:hypothetical protein CF326_g4600 [Tilletia indica]|nr:hypothetical protein CF326_g4600 [Tilletia indica]
MSDMAIDRSRPGMSSRDVVAADEATPLLQSSSAGVDSRSVPVKSNKLRNLYLDEVTRVMILGALCTGCYNSMAGYQILTDRSFVCSLYYSAIDPDNPAKNAQYPCRQPEIERTLATIVAISVAISGILNAISLLVFCRWMRKIGVKNLVLISMAADIIFLKLPYYILPLGPPLGRSDPWASPVAANVIIIVGVFFNSIFGGNVLMGFAMKSMLIDIAPQSDLGKILSRYLVLLFVSVALAPMLVVAFTRWADQVWGQSLLWTTPHPPPPQDIRPSPGPVPAPIVPGDGGGHHPHAYLAGIILGLVTIAWCILFTRNTAPPDVAPKVVGNASSEAETECRTSRRSTPTATLKRVGHAILEMLKPLAILSPTALNGDVPTSERRPDWTLTRITISSSAALFFTNVGQMIYEYLTYAFAYDGEQVSLLVSITCAITSVIVLLGIPAIYAVLEERMDRPPELRGLTRKELNHLGDEIDAVETSAGGSATDTADYFQPTANRGAVPDGDEPHHIAIGSHIVTISTPAEQIAEDDRHIIHRSFTLWRVRVELACSRIILAIGTLPWVLIGMTLAVLGVKNASTGTILVGLTLLSAIVFNAEAPLNASAMALIKAKGGGTAQRDEYITALSFIHLLTAFVSPLISSFIYAVTLTSAPGTVYLVAAAGLFWSLALIPKKIQGQ